MARRTQKYPCKLPHYEVEEVLTLEEVVQRPGWNITAFDLPEVWKWTQGEGVKIAIIDTGVQLDHPDLVQNLLPGYNFIKPGTPPYDDVFHGTHCAGIIAAENNTFGSIGVAPKAKIIPIKVLNERGGGDFLTVSKGIKWAVDNGADIIVLSLGSPRPIRQVRVAIQYAASKNIPVFCAAGNAGRGRQTQELFYPANYPEPIAVGSIDENFDRSVFSNTGERLDFMAPGHRIFSTVPTNWYAYMSGTSQAAPFVAGIAALCLSYQRQHYPDKPFKGAEDFRRLFRAHTIPITNKEYAGKKFFQGFGIINTKDFRTWIEAN